jgi:hypothetical protein
MQDTIGAIRLEPGRYITFSCRACGHKPRPRTDACGGLHGHWVQAVVPKGGTTVVTFRLCAHCPVKSHTAKPATQIMYVDA